MAYNVDQFRQVIADTLLMYGLHSPEAVALLLGTAAVESDFGTFLRQKHGPAMGAFQMEPATFFDIRDRRFMQYPVLVHCIPEKMIVNLQLATLMARLKYKDAPPALPPANDIEEQGRYWKKWYNSKLGKGQPEDYVVKFNRYVLGKD